MQSTKSTSQKCLSPTNWNLYGRNRSDRQQPGAITLGKRGRLRRGPRYNICPTTSIAAGMVAADEKISFPVGAGCNCDDVGLDQDHSRHCPVSGRAVLIRTLPVKLWIPWQRKRLTPIVLRSSPRAR